MCVSVCLYAAERLRDFDIKIGTTLNRQCLAGFRNIAHVPDQLKSGETRNISAVTSHAGRYLMIQLRDKNFLTLCEVKVYGGI